MSVCVLCGGDNPPGAAFCAVRTCGTALPEGLSGEPGETLTPEQGVQAAVLGPELVVVPPGERTRLDVRVRNSGRRPEWVGVRVDGLPAGWASLEDDPQTLPPGGERLVGLHLAVPRDAGAPGVREVDVVFASPDWPGPGVGARARLLLDIPACPRLVVRPAAERLRVRGRRFLPVVVDNDGNAPAMVTVLATVGGAPDAADASAADTEPLTIACVPERLEVPAGGSATVSVRVSPWRARLVGKAHEEWLAVTARSGRLTETAWVRLERLPRLSPRLRRVRGGAVFRETGGTRARRVLRERRTSWRALAIAIVTSVAVSLAATLIVAAIIQPRHQQASPATPSPSAPGGRGSTP